MNYLIFRTDRIGDFLITSSLIKAIKRNDAKSKIYIVASNKNKEFIKKAKKLYGDKYDYSRIVYKGRNVKVTIGCPIHSWFEQVPATHTNKKNNSNSYNPCGC